MAQQEQTPANSKTKKFLKGTMILTISSIVVKVIGALNWVILSRVMGGEGIGLYQMGFPIYLMAITVSSAGIPVAISIVTAEKVAKKDYGGAQHVFKVSLWMMLATGLLFTGALLGLAHFLVESGFIPDPRAYYSIIALAPAVFFVTFLSSFRGYFQGWQIMTPTACSEITEQLIRVVTMIAFSYLLLPYGLTYAAAGASMGAGAGAFCGLLVLLGFYRKLKHKFFPQGEENVPPQEPEPAGEIIKRLIMLALPVSMASLMLPIVSNLDMVIVPRRLMAGGWSMSEATTLFGYLTGMAVPLVNMSTILTAALSISLVPAISESRTLEDTEGIREKVAAAFSVAAVITIPCSIGLHVLGGRVAALIYNAPKAGPSIETMSWAIFLLGLHQVSTGILQGLGGGYRYRGHPEPVLHQEVYRLLSGAEAAAEDGRGSGGHGSCCEGLFGPGAQLGGLEHPGGHGCGHPGIRPAAAGPEDHAGRRAGPDPLCGTAHGAAGPYVEIVVKIKSETLCKIFDNRLEATFHPR